MQDGTSDKESAIIDVENTPAGEDILSSVIEEKEQSNSGVWIKNDFFVLSKDDQAILVNTT